MLLSLRPLILGSRRIGWISSCTRGRAEVSELARPRRFSAPMLAILAAAVVGLRGPGASQPESLRSAFHEMCALLRCPRRHRACFVGGGPLHCKLSERGSRGISPIDVTCQLPRSSDHCHFGSKSRLVIHARHRTRHRPLCGLAHPVSPCAARCYTLCVHRALHGATQPVSL